MCERHCGDSLLSLKERDREGFKLERRVSAAPIPTSNLFTETHGTYTHLTWQFCTSFWELMGTCIGSLILWQLQLYEQLIVFDATNNGFQKGKTKYSFNNVLHSFWKWTVQSTGIFWQSRKRVLVFACLLCLAIRDYSSKHKYLTRILQNSLIWRGVQNDQGKIRLFLSHQVSERSLRRKRWLVLSHLHQNRGGSNQTSAAAWGFWVRHEKSFPDWGMFSTGIHHQKRMLKHCWRVNMSGFFTWGEGCNA